MSAEDAVAGGAAMTWPTVSVTLSLLVSLSIARLLMGLVAIFRGRTRAEMDWVVIAWAVMLLVTILQAWMALNLLPLLADSFSFGEYLGLGGMMMLLYAAASLLMPVSELEEGSSLKALFAADGRFALLLYAAYLAVAAVVNVVLFDAPVVAVWAVLDVPMVALPLLVFAARTRRTVQILTAVAIPLFALDLLVSLQP